jgi:hypothetical protein
MATEYRYKNQFVSVDEAHEGGARTVERQVFSSTNEAKRRNRAKRRPVWNAVKLGKLPVGTPGCVVNQVNGLTPRHEAGKAVL